MKRLTIFCGSSEGNEPIFREAATALGKELAGRNIGLVYGGAKIGLMGAVADAVLEAGGEAIGVIPHFLRTKEVAHDSLTQLILVDSMHERKTKMNDLCDGVIALPGGYGTLEELFEMLTWAQLGLHRKPIGLFNVNGFYNPLIEMIRNTVDKGFLKSIDHERLLVATSAAGVLKRMKEYNAPVVGKWIHKDEL